MLPLEVVFIMLVFLWGLIGVVRGFASEIGSTISIILAMAALSFFGPKIIGALNQIAGFAKISALTIPAAPAQGTFCYQASQQQFFFYLIFFTVIVFLGYQGDTFAVPHKLAQVPGSIVGFFVGMVNGWLVAGDLWYLLQQCAGYFVPAIGIKGVGVLSDTAQILYKVVPFNTPLGSPAVLLGVLFLLLILRIVK